METDCSAMTMGRDAVLRFAVGLGVSVALITDGFGALGWLRPLPVTAVWMCGIFALVWWVARRAQPVRWERPGVFDSILLLCLGGISSVLLVVALLSPPNSTDAMAYHMPRVVYWAQAGKVHFFPTSYFNQVSLQPLAEYFILHTWILSGGDWFANLVQWFGFTASIAGVSLVARQLGAGRRGQLLAAVFCATLPNGILQASGAKNDCLLALWLTAMVYFALRREPGWSAASAALALFTKATAYLFVPPLLLACGLRWWLRPRAVGALVGFLLLINGPLYWRNFVLSGSPMGFDSAQGDGVFRWRVERISLRGTASNGLRHLSDQLGFRSENWNKAVFRAVVRAHQWIGTDPNDPATTWPWISYEPPRNANHETNGNNHWHLLLLIGVCAAAVWRARWKSSAPGRYLLGLAVAFLLFCAYLKWQLFMARLLLPLFVLAAPLAGYFGEKLKPAVQILLCLLLVNSTRPFLFENWVRPLKGPNSLLVTRREDAYFNDMKTWNNKESYLETVDLVAASGCRRVGIDIDHLTLEYPLQALLRAQVADIQFTHTGSKLAAQSVCAVVCLDCAGDEAKLHLYQKAGRLDRAGRFLIWTKPTSSELR